METPIPAILWLAILIGFLVLLVTGGALWALDGQRDATQVCSDCKATIRQGDPDLISHGLCRSCGDALIQQARREHQVRLLQGSSRREEAHSHLPDAPSATIS